MTLLKSEITGIRNTIKLLGMARVQYMRSGSRSDILDSIFQIENKLHEDLKRNENGKEIKN